METRLHLGEGHLCTNFLILAKLELQFHHREALVRQAHLWAGNRPVCESLAAREANIESEPIQGNRLVLLEIEQIFHHYALKGHIRTAENRFMFHRNKSISSRVMSCVVEEAGDEAARSVISRECASKWMYPTLRCQSGCDRIRSKVAQVWNPKAVIGRLCAAKANSGRNTCLRTRPSL